MITGTALAVVWMFNSFASVASVEQLKHQDVVLETQHEDLVSSEDFEEFSVEVYYEQYYNLLERLFNAEDQGQDELANEFGKRLEKLKVKICRIDPEWDRCDEHN